MHGLQHLGRKLVLTLHVNHCGPLASEGKRGAFCHLSVRRVMGAPTSTVSRYFSKRTQFWLGTGRHCVPTSLAAGGSHVVQLCQPWEKVIRTISTHILAGAAAHLHQSPFLLPVAEDRGNTDHKYSEGKPAPIRKAGPRTERQGKGNLGPYMSPKSSVTFPPWTTLPADTIAMFGPVFGGLFVTAP